MPQSDTHATFAPTPWTLLQRARGGAPEERHAALEAIARAYWPAVYASLRHSGRPPEEAGEITQAFFAEVVLGRGLLEAADEDRGRLRTLMLSALKRFTIDRHRRSEARGGRSVASLDHLEREEALIADERGEDPEAAFDRRWATAVLDQALERCEQHFRAAGKTNHWALFDARIVQPAVRGCEARPLRSMASELGFASAADAAAAVQVVKKRVLVLLREVAAETAERPEDQDAEYRHLVATLA